MNVNDCLELHNECNNSALWFEEGFSVMVNTNKMHLVGSLNGMIQKCCVIFDYSL